MRAVVRTASGVAVADVPEPTLRDPDDVIVEVTHAAVCGTDLHLLAHPEGLREGTVLGHEFVGHVVALGARVAGLAVGDRVVASDYTACGRCWWCRQGDHWHCTDRLFFGTGTTFGPELPGGQAERVRVPFGETCLRRLPASIDSTAALVLGDSLATGYAAASRLDLAPGGVVAVIGGGPVGQLAALSAQAFGAAHVVVVEPVEDRRGLAARLGSIATTPERAMAVVEDLTEGRGADGVIDAVGAPLGLDAGIALVRDAGTVVSVGVPVEPTLALPGTLFERELTVGFAIGNLIRDGERLVGLLSSGLIPVDDLLDTGFTLQQAAEAYDAMRRRRITKAVLTA